MSKQSETKENVAVAVSEYTVAEFVEQAHIFGTSAEVVAVALREKQVKTATVERAKKIVKDFLERKV